MESCSQYHEIGAKTSRSERRGEKKDYLRIKEINHKRGISAERSGSESTKRKHRLEKETRGWRKEEQKGRYVRVKFKQNYPNKNERIMKGHDDTRTADDQNF